MERTQPLPAVEPNPAIAAPARICAVLTSFNRKAYTLECLALLAASAAQARVELTAILVDDGSTDGTAQGVEAEFPWVNVLRGDGNLFWNRGMRMGMQRVLDGSGRAPDAILWLNDDTHLLPDALTRLLVAADGVRRRRGREGIVVGATCDRVSGRLSYGGNVSAGRWRPFTFRKVHSPDEAVPCETMNGNVVLLPLAVARDVGNLDPVFEHAMGDIDYGLRAHRRGHPIVVAPGFVGHCSNNPRTGSHRDEALSLRERWRKITQRKELPPRSWLQLTRRHGGLLWPLYFVWPYARVLASGTWRGLGKRR